MKTTWIAVLSLLGILLIPAGVHARQTPDYPGNDQAVDDGIPANDPDETGVTDFQEELPPDLGQWTDTDQYGPVWVPQVDSNWRPYTDGRWANTDQGWAWMSNEPWGWATYHYGRWFYDASLGWTWVPGSVWAPAWVAWQEGDGYLGWAPLPPSVGFTFQASLDFGRTRLGPKFYTFVQERDILAARISRVIVTTWRNEAIMTSTRDVTRYTVVHNHVVNQSIDSQRIARITGRRVPMLHVASLATKGQAGRGPFYQPPAIRKARANRAEFGAALSAQAAAQRRVIRQPRPPGSTTGYRGPSSTSTPWSSTSRSNTNPRPGTSSGSTQGWGTLPPRSQPPSARPSQPPQRQSPPPARPSPPPQRPSAPPARPSSPPAKGGGSKPPL